MYGRHVRLLIAVIVCIGSLFAIPTPSNAAGKVPRFEKAGCMFKLPDDVVEGQTVKCGYLIVLENRSKPNGRTIKLPVAIFSSQSENPAPEPIIYLEGGPGGSVLKDFGAYVTEASYAAFWLANHNLILFDQRGEGYAQPTLDCKETDAEEIAALSQPLTPDEETQLYVDATLKCHDRLVKQGIDLAQYNSAASAADIEDLLTLLGYDQVNVYGISYGTRLALTLMRDFPDHLRAVVIDGVLPVQANLLGAIPVDAQHDFETLFKGCAADTTCNKKFPNLEKVFYDLVAKLNETPISVQIKDSETGKTYKWVVTGYRFLNTVFGSLYATDLIPYLPLLIYQTKNGDTKLLALIGGFLNFSYLSTGLYYSVECNEEIPFENKAEIDKALAQVKAEFKAEYSPDSELAICKGWKVPAPSAKENEPVKSDIPTLVLSGEYDPITPAPLAKEAASTLTNSFRFVFPGLGHGALGAGDCPASIFQAFLAGPATKPDASCIDDMPEPTFKTSFNGN